MVQEVTVNVYDQTGAVSQKGFGLPLVFTPTKDVDYQEVTDTSEITGLVAGDLAYEKANVLLSQEPKVEKVALYGVDIATAGTAIEDELDDLITNHNDWYWGIIASRDDVEITDFASWITSKEKIGAAQLDIAKTATEVETFMSGLENQRMIVCAHDGGVNTEDQYLAAGLVGRIAPLTPGSYTAKFKTINTVAATTYLDADVSTILDSNCNTYVSSMGEDYLSEGKLSDGSFIDTQVAKDWVAARYREGIFRLLKANEKIAFDDSGIAQIVSVIKSINQEAARMGIAAQDADGNYLMSVEYPRRVDVPDNDKANRVLSGLKTTITFAGAIHNAQVDFYLEI